jgi:hypothetical protein
VHYAAAAICSDVQLHPKMPLIAFFRLAHLRVARLLLVLRRAGCCDDRRIHDRARTNLDPLLLQVLIHPAKEPSPQIMPLQQTPKLQ